MTPPRLHVIPATGCDKALILRRGPKGQVASLLWDRGTGDIALGQWLKGRIYEYRSDLSPDGRHMVIFAGTGNRWWTALSRAPWLTAIAYWPTDSTWFGGGAFTADGRLFLNGAEPAGDLPDDLEPAPADAFPHGTDGFHMGGLYAARLALAGWRHVAGEGYETQLEKPLKHGWRLHQSFRLGGQDRSLIASSYVLIDPDGAAHPRPDWEWADAWADGLQVAANGALWQAESALATPTRIHGFTDMAFEPRMAPYQGIDA